ncbi:apses transcription factor xbp1 [Fusarium longipes]|uniref:Apses transcription factor xbp1 n=1 Tax=Fusarium longipes TaxID=694270 RepID=A0A395SMR1_9HYPO|nr:apses transcription factor xbp1 [Fusarium longipes]
MMATDRVSFKDTNNLAKSKLRGQVRFPPHEHLDEVALQEVRRHRVTPFGNIHETCLHIPYNSGKKDFFEKTGRESFEVFKYEFVSLEHGTEYAVMWDYNIGLVRMTPFFKCRGYGKAS